MKGTSKMSKETPSWSDDRGQPPLTNGFTNTILMHLLGEGRVHKHPILAGRWIITGTEFQKRSNP